DRWSEAMTLNSLGNVLRVRGDAAAASAAYEQALPTLRAMNGGQTPHTMLHNQGYVALARGDARGAARLFLESADGYTRAGRAKGGLAECVIGLAAAAVRLREPQLAARLFGAAQAALASLGTTITPSNRADYEAARGRLAASLPSERIASMEDAGRTLSLEQAVDLARTVDQAAPDVDAAPAALAGLTPRELEVAGLLARGSRNRQIAEQLVITEKTAANHVQRVLEKLGIHSRAELAARAEELGLEALALS